MRNALNVTNEKMACLHAQIVFIFGPPFQPGGGFIYRAAKSWPPRNHRGAPGCHPQCQHPAWAHSLALFGRPCGCGEMDVWESITSLYRLKTIPWCGSIQQAKIYSRTFIYVRWQYLQEIHRKTILESEILIINVFFLKKTTAFVHRECWLRKRNTKLKICHWSLPFGVLAFIRWGRS